MGFDKRDNAKRYTAEEGDTLQSIAERETAAGNPVTWQEIAKYNWGTDDENEVNEYLRDELGCRWRDADNNFVISADDEPASDLLIPLSFKKEGLALSRTHTIRVRMKKSPPQFLECCTIPGVTFAYDKSFIRPAVVDYMQPLEEALDRNPDARVLIFGHTDKVGDEHYNKALSERRALSAYAFIVNDAATWEQLYNEENWGVAVVQEILGALDEPYYLGPITGWNDGPTQAAVRRYQEDRGLAVDGVAGPQTRGVLFEEYMTGKHDIELTPDQFVDPKHMGCGEFNPIEDTEAAHEPNRRVVFYLFHKERPPRAPCQHGSTGPCHLQMEQSEFRFVETFRCSFYDSISKKCSGEGPPPEVDLGIFLMQVFDAEGREPLADRSYTISSPSLTIEGVLDAEGKLRHEDIPAGDYTISIEGVETEVAALVFDASENEHQVRFLEG